MNRMVTLSGIPLLVALFLSPQSACAAGAKVLLDHKLTGYTKEDSSVTVTYSLHIRNSGATPLTDLTLTLIPRPPLIGKPLSVTIGSLAPGNDLRLPLQTTTGMPLDRDSIAKHPLYWTGKGRESNGKEVSFTAVSRPGGAK